MLVWNSSSVSFYATCSFYIKIVIFVVVLTFVLTDIFVVSNFSSSIDIFDSTNTILKCHLNILRKKTNGQHICHTLNHMWNIMGILNSLGTVLAIFELKLDIPLPNYLYKVASSSFAHREVCSIQPYVILLDSDLMLVSAFLWQVCFSPPNTKTDHHNRLLKVALNTNYLTMNNLYRSVLI